MKIIFDKLIWKVQIFKCYVDLLWTSNFTLCSWNERHWQHKRKNWQLYYYFMLHIHIFNSKPKWNTFFFPQWSKKMHLEINSNIWQLVFKWKFKCKINWINQIFTWHTQFTIHIQPKMKHTCFFKLGSFT